MTLRVLLSLLGFIPTLVLGNGLLELQSFLKDVKTAQGEFTQEVVDKNGKLIDGPSSGFFKFSRPGNFIWEYQSPCAQTMVSDGKKLWMWDKDLEQITVRRLKGSLPSSPASILFGSSELDKDWIVQNTYEKGNVHWVKLLPKSKDFAFSEVLVGFKDKALAKIQFTGNLGETSKLEFNKVQTGIQFSKKEFVFSPPKGVDVLKVD